VTEEVEEVVEKVIEEPKEEIKEEPKEETKKTASKTITTLNRVELYKGNKVSPQRAGFLNPGITVPYVTMQQNFIILDDEKYVKRSDEGTRYIVNG
jgi:hypothetical protein